REDDAPPPDDPVVAERAADPELLGPIVPRSPDPCGHVRDDAGDDEEPEEPRQRLRRALQRREDDLLERDAEDDRAGDADDDPLPRREVEVDGSEREEDADRE